MSTLEAGSTRKPRLLIIAPRYPFPPIGGDRLRLHHLARVLSERFELTLASLCEEDPSTLPAPPPGLYGHIHCVRLPAWRSWLNCAIALFRPQALQVAYYQSADLATLVKRLAPEHDIVMAHLIRTAPYAAELPMPRVLEMTDAISMNLSRSIGHPRWLSIKSWVYRIEVRRAARAEDEALMTFDATSVISAVDQAYLLDRVPEAAPRLVVAANGVSADRRIAAGRTKDVVFIGNLATLQNQDALWFFVREVWPQTLRKHPDARLRVVGPVGRLQRAALSKVSGLVVVGSVDSLADALDGAAVGVCPVRIGAGVQNKLLDYLAHGLPAVTSAVGFEGIDMHPGHHVIVALSTAEWIKSVDWVLCHPVEAAAMAEAGRARVERRYRWGDSIAPLANRLCEIASVGLPQSQPRQPAHPRSLTVS